uniref:Novel immune-type receptor 3b n=1 Tax=Sinocyclocheilus anshuiensis TaxID=1608454 RepID=A0A671LZ05_9TELE
ISVYYHILLVAELGCSVIIPCSHSDDFINTVSWYKHSLGKKPLLIAYSEHGSDSVTYQNGFKKENQYFIRSGTGSFNLTIIHLEEYDSATYYCAVSFLNIITFGEGTILLRKGERTTVLQQPVSDRLHPGDSVTLQCSVISQICAGEYSVYWFRHSSGHSDPGIIYTHDNRSDQSMERSESSSSTQKIIHVHEKKKYIYSQKTIHVHKIGIYIHKISFTNAKHNSQMFNCVQNIFECLKFTNLLWAVNVNRLGFVCVFLRLSWQRTPPTRDTRTL